MTTSLGRRTATTALLAGVLVTPALATATTSYGAAPGAHATQATPEAPAAPATPAAPTSFPVAGLPDGARPRIPFAFASTVGFGGGAWRLHRADGTTMRLPRITWSQWAPLGRGAIGMTGTEAGPRLDRVSASGSVRTTLVPHFGIAVSPDHRIVGWFGAHHRPRVVEGGGSRTFSMPRVPHGSAIATIAGTRTCQESVPEGGGCSVFVNQGGTRVWVSTSHGIVDTVGRIRRMVDVSNRGRATGLVSPATSTSPSCYGMVDATRRLWRTCDYRLTTFAPGGRRVLAIRSQAKWDSVTTFAMLGRDGHVVHAWTFDPSRTRSLSQLTWEDPDHLLGRLWAHGRWSVVRIGADGSVERALRRVQGAGDVAPYSLPQR